MSDDEIINNEDWYLPKFAQPMKILTNPKFICPVHGEHENYISVTVPEYKGYYCMKCAIEKMIELGVRKLTKVEPALHPPTHWQPLPAPPVIYLSEGR